MDIEKPILLLQIADVA